MLTDRQIKVLQALDRSSTSSLDSIAGRLGYRPARNGRLAVLKTLRSLMGEAGVEQYGETGKYVGRLPPRDQWSCEHWFLTAAGEAASATSSPPKPANRA